MNDTNNALTTSGKAELPTPNRSRAQKAATVLALLDDETLQNLSGKLSFQHREKLAEAIRSLRKVDVQEQRKIAKEFAEDLARGRNAVRPKDEDAERLGSALFQEPEIEELPELDFQLDMPTMDDLVDEDSGPDIWDQVACMPVPAIAAFFADKSSAVLSVAIAKLPEDYASEVFAELEIDPVKFAMIHTATNGEPNPVAIEAVENLIKEELLSDDAPVVLDTDGPQNADKVANFLNRMVSSRRDAILDALEQELDEENMMAIRDKVLSFGALKDRLPRSAIPMILREFDEKSMLTTLKFAGVKDSDTVDYMLANISQRMATQYREKMDEMAAIDEEEGEKAQSAFVCKILSMADNGQIELMASG